MRGKDMRVQTFAWRVVAAIALAGCGENPTGPNEDFNAGPPEILQLFVLDQQGDLRLAAGNHCQITGVPAVASETCQDDGTPFGDAAGPVTDAMAGGNRIRIVFDEPLAGSTVEQFQCACWGNGCTTRGHIFVAGTTVDPTRCLSCADDVTTVEVDETGLCADLNFDGVPDTSFLQPDLVTIDCGGLSVPIAEDDGFFSRAGNQLIPTGLGVEGLGPALVLDPPPLPRNSDCVVTVRPNVTDRDGLAVPAPAFPLAFHTEL
jgi:hypothetical protein